jgi:hypothetical protein
MASAKHGRPTANPTVNPIEDLPCWLGMGNVPLVVRLLGRMVVELRVKSVSYRG